VNIDDIQQEIKYLAPCRLTPSPPSPAPPSLFY